MGVFLMSTRIPSSQGNMSPSGKSILSTTPPKLKRVTRTEQIKHDTPSWDIVDMGALPDTFSKLTIQKPALRIQIPKDTDYSDREDAASTPSFFDGPVDTPDHTNATETSKDRMDIECHDQDANEPPIVDRRKRLRRATPMPVIPSGSPHTTEAGIESSPFQFINFSEPEHRHTGLVDLPRIVKRQAVEPIVSETSETTTIPSSSPMALLRESLQQLRKQFERKPFES
jgi:hypothetical protein